MRMKYTYLLEYSFETSACYYSVFGFVIIYIFLLSLGLCWGKSLNGNIRLCHDHVYMTFHSHSNHIKTCMCVIFFNFLPIHGRCFLKSITLYFRSHYTEYYPGRRKDIIKISTARLQFIESIVPERETQYPNNHWCYYYKGMIVMALRRSAQTTYILRTLLRPIFKFFL